MDYYSAYTLEEAMDNLEVWKACEKALATGQAKSYKIGSREFTSFDIKEVHGMVIYFKNIIATLQRKTRRNSVVRAIPRDL